MSFIIDATDGWLTNWEEEGGRFKEWIRSISLRSINHGWFYALYMEPVYLWRKAWNVVTWIPFLWDDYDWDHVYLWKVMRFKIERMRKDQEEGQNHEDWKKVADQMRSAEFVLTRLIDDEYVTEEWEEHRKKYGSIMDRHEKVDPNSKLGKQGIAAITRPHRDPACGRDVVRIAKLDDKRRNDDMEYLGKYLAKHVRGWWS